MIHTLLYLLLTLSQIDPIYYHEAVEPEKIDVHIVSSVHRLKT